MMERKLTRAFLARLAHPLVFPVLLGQAVLLAGCGGGGSGGGGGGGAGMASSAHFLIGDAPRDDLLSFTAEVGTLQLERTDGKLTENLLPGPVTVEFIDLEETFAWLTSARPGNGSYVAAHVGFVPLSYAALAEDGSPVTVNAVTTTASRSTSTSSTPSRVTCRRGS